MVEARAEDRPRCFRELVAFSRNRPSQPAEQYRNMLTSAELPLTGGHDLPPDALCC